MARPLHAPKTADIGSRRLRVAGSPRGASTSYFALRSWRGRDLGWLRRPAGEPQSSLSPGYAAADARYTPSERVGREIWFFATAFNDRFFTYSYPQRLGAVIDWYLVLGAQNKKDLFQAWGAIPDPDCCVPGDANCPARSLDETYGFQWCLGDDELLEYVVKEGYRGPVPQPSLRP